MPETYRVYVNDSYDDENGSGEYEAGEMVIIRAGIRENYGFNNWNTIGIILADHTMSVNSFIMPSCDVKTIALWEEMNLENRVRYIHPPASIYIHELKVNYEARPSGINDGMYIVNEILLPANVTGVDKIYTFEIYVNSISTGIIGHMTVRYTSIQVLEASRIIIHPSRLMSKGGAVSVRIEFKLPTI